MSLIWEEMEAIKRILSLENMLSIGLFFYISELNRLFVVLVCEYAFPIESALCSCLNVKEPLAQSRREIWSLSENNWIRTDNHLVHKQTLSHFAKLPTYELSCCGFESSGNLSLSMFISFMLIKKECILYDL